MRRSKWIVYLLPVLLLLSGRQLPAQWSTRVEVEPPPYSPSVTPYPRPAFCDPIDVRIEADRRFYSPGDSVTLTARVSEEAWLFVFSSDGSGRTHQLFPNYYDRDNLLRRGQIKRLPSGRYRLAASGAGWDTITAIAIAPGDSGWRPPAWMYDYNSREPFRPWRYGVDDARRALDADLERAVENRRRQVEVRKLGPMQSRVVIGDPRDERPCWGEATTAIHVRRRVESPWSPWEPPNHWTDPPNYPDHDERRGASMDIRTTPSGADIYIDGRYYGRTPEKIHLRPGRYEVELVRQGYRPRRMTKTLEEDANESYSVRLQRGR